MLSFFVLAEACGDGSEDWAGTFEPEEVDQEIVDFAVSQFSSIDQICYHINTENFQSKVKLQAERSEV